MVEGKRKFWIIIIGIIAEIIGLIISLFGKLDLGLFTAFSGAVVALCGLFFNANIKEHRIKEGSKPNG